jgi:hypothetical protein
MIMISSELCLNEYQWISKLLARNTVTLPACVVKTIREEFPSPDGNYEGFKECVCESDISDSD